MCHRTSSLALRDSFLETQNKAYHLNSFSMLHLFFLVTTASVHM